jgi:ketosteroid isomerase-like protein
MNRMSSLAGLACGLLLSLAACKKEEPPPPPQPEAKAVEPTKEEPPKALTAEERGKWYLDCWGHFNAKAWDEFKKCYAADAEVDDVDTGMPMAKGADAVIERAKLRVQGLPDVAGEAQLVLVSGNTIMGAWLVKGTHTEKMTGPDGKEVPPSNKKLGVLLGHVVQTSDDGRGVTREWGFMDMGSMTGQLGLNPGPHRPAMDKGVETPTVVLSADDQKEKDNLALVAREVEAYNKHDEKALAELYADDLVWTESTMPDMDKKAMLKGLAGMWKGFSDMKVTPETTIAAGDYVGQVGTMAGTNDGDFPPMKLKKTKKTVSGRYMRILRIEEGKIAQSWLFYNSMVWAVQLGLIPPPGGTPGEAPADAPAPKKG